MMNAKKLVKWGVALTSTLVLGGVVGPVGGQLLNASSIVYAQNQESVTAILTFYDVSDLSEIADRVYIDIKPGESIVYNYPVFDGYTLHEDYDSILILDYESVARRNGETIATGFRKVEKPAETPTEQPTEKPVTTPTEQPVEKPITYRIHYFLNDVVENGGTPSYTDIAPYKEGVISKGETIVEVAPHIDGYAVYEVNSIPITYDHFTGDNVWHDNDWYPADGFLYNKIETPVAQPVEQPAEKPVEQPVETPIEQPADQPVDQPAETSTAQPVETPAGQPTDQPAATPTEKPAEQPVETPTEKPAEQPVETPTEQPVEQPAEKPVDQPVNQPTEKPTSTSLLAGKTASKAQPVVATDKKKVDNSTLSTTAVKSEEGSQATAKTLPKTGDSNSMFLVLGGLLSGLSGLGLVAPSRKRD
ncbi:TPA: LPXTG cell wall anchor domain-containing protein [Streptococcus suis]